MSCSRPWRTGVTKVRLKLDQPFTISRKSFEGKVQPILRFLGVLVVTSVGPYWIIPGSPALLSFPSLQSSIDVIIVQLDGFSKPACW